MNDENVEGIGGDSSGDDENEEEIGGSDIVEDSSSEHSDGLPPVVIHREEELAVMSESEPSIESGSAPSSASEEDEVPIYAVDVEVIDGMHEFEKPTRKIRTWDDVRAFDQWEPMQNFFGFIVGLSNSVEGTYLYTIRHISDNVRNILRVLNTVSNWIDEEIPGEDGELIPSYKRWQLRLYNGQYLMDMILPAHFHGATEEVFFYFLRSFGTLNGNAYGLHHELMFIAWLYCLARLGAIEFKDYPAIVAKVMIRYRDTVKKMKTSFGIIERVNMARGPGADEFLTYIFGSAELIGKDDTHPLLSLSDKLDVSRLASKTLFFQLVWERAEGGRYAISFEARLLRDKRNWNAANKSLLEDYRDMLGELTLLRKLKSGSLLRLI